METHVVLLGVGWLTKINAGEYYEVAIYRFDDRGALLLLPYDIVKYDPTILNESNVKGYGCRAEGLQIDINCCDRIGSIILKMHSGKYYDETLKKLIEMKG
ncbi:hypothetical protein Trydic_g5322 [Trypoxylus dichotomus]